MTKKNLNIKISAEKLDRFRDLIQEKRPDLTNNDYSVSLNAYEFLFDLGINLLERA